MDHARLRVGDLELDVLVPVTRRERTKGLRGAPPTPMLFERARSVHTVGMRETIVVAFLDRELRIVRVTVVPPRRLVWHRGARHVLEAPIGTDLRVGDRLARAPGASR